MVKTNSCKICKESFVPAHKHPNQKLCHRKSCKTKWKAKWQKQKMKNDLDYKKNQQQCNLEWKLKNPDYWKRYRQKNPEKQKIDMISQRIRNLKNKSKQKPESLKMDLVKIIAKMDLVKSPDNKKMLNFGLSFLIANMDLVNFCFLIETDS